VGLLSITSTAALAVTPLVGQFTGKTSQKLPLTFQVFNSGATILNFQPEIIGGCTKGSAHKTTQAITTDAGRDIAILGGVFSAHARGKLHAGTTTVGTATDQVKGRFTSEHSVKGTYTVTFKFARNAPDGLAGYKCHTGTVKFTAHRV
jgi:hypothetical protein